ncbi:uncharacterized protein LOC9642437 [Selaginella moellendorffii]|uniref:uncharacterized protein LOC9642437 n=1 Tax=Selaginella moellendorffii TaxID=88036 RepID=UPI000D1CF46F|nr:uncharacterized protein LOC9642437 [Selaginella moellendorffii]|eukprot:XP_024534418.1 uncharacterized protein LOC9642437 [Selaginella moellendorffii]
MCSESFLPKGMSHGSRFGVCPCCHASIALFFMDSHLDTCLRRSYEEDYVEPDDEKSEEEPQTKQEVFPLFRQRKKIIHIIRHGHTLFQQGDQKMIDVRLSAQGIQQASCIGQQLLSLKPDVILVSPLTRALDTLKWALHPFKDERSSLRLEVSSLHTEHVAGAGDIGRDPQVLSLDFPWLSFEKLDPVWWFSPPEAPNIGAFRTRENTANLRKRVASFRRHLLSRPEQVIAVVGHSTFFMVLTGEKKRMRHCEFRKLAI